MARVTLRKGLQTVAIALLLQFGWVIPAAAQAGDSGTVAAVADLDGSGSRPISLSGSPLDFGPVSRPNGASPGAICEWDMAVDGPGTTLILRHIAQGSSTWIEGYPNPSNCQHLGTYSSAKFEVSCDPLNDVTFMLSYANGGVTGVTLMPSRGVRMSYVNRGATNGGLAGTVFDTMTVPCPNGSTGSIVPGELDLYVGGRLQIDSDAATGTDIVVGTLTVTAMY